MNEAWTNHGRSMEDPDIHASSKNSSTLHCQVNSPDGRWVVLMGPTPGVGMHAALAL